MTKIIDAFLFTHEFDLLELRLRTLWDSVDKFILMEGDYNFANEPKPMKFDWTRFEWAREKLIHCQHIGPFKSYNGEINVVSELYVEHQHRQYLYDTVKKMPFAPEDILMISDVDELPSREVIALLRTYEWPSPTLLHQEFYYYNIKCHRGKKWNGTMVMRFGHELGDVGAARMNRKNMPYLASNCGWHLAHFYDSEGIKEKLQHSSHRAYYHPSYYDPEHLKKCVEQNKNYLGKEDGTAHAEPLPEYLLNEMRKFPIMMGDEWR